MYARDNSTTRRLLQIDMTIPVCLETACVLSSFFVAVVVECTTCRPVKNAAQACIFKLILRNVAFKMASSYRSVSTQNTLVHNVFCCDFRSGRCDRSRRADGSRLRRHLVVRNSRLPSTVGETRGE